jgi:hypothetical protein
VHHANRHCVALGRFTDLRVRIGSRIEPQRGHTLDDAIEPLLISLGADDDESDSHRRTGHQ